MDKSWSGSKLGSSLEGDKYETWRDVRIGFSQVNMSRFEIEFPSS